MSAVERINDAIYKLETLKAESTPGPWFRYYDYIETGDDDPSSTSDEPNRVRVAKTNWGTVQISRDLRRITDAQLITVLHGTIDAQIAVLRYGLGGANDLSRGASPDEPAGTDVALALADAILGPDRSTPLTH